MVAAADTEFGSARLAALAAASFQRAQTLSPEVRYEAALLIALSASQTPGGGAYSGEVLAPLIQVFYLRITPPPPTHTPLVTAVCSFLPYVIPAAAHSCKRRNTEREREGGGRAADVRGIFDRKQAASASGPAAGAMAGECEEHTKIPPAPCGYQK